jgi:hypothetical protein
MAAVSTRPATRKPSAPPSRPGAKSNSLRHAASAVFAVTTVLPLLIFVLTLHRIGALNQQQSQVGLGLALGVALFGFYIFRRLMGQMSDLISALGRVVAQSARASGEPRVAGTPAAVPSAVALHRAADERSQSPAAPAQAVAAPAVPTAPRIARQAEPVVVPLHETAPVATSVPGLGAIREVDDLSHAMAKLWMGEAIVYKGRRVSVSIMNARVPIVGTLADLTREGLLVDQDGGQQVAVSYDRLSGIDAA